MTKSSHSFVKFGNTDEERDAKSQLGHLISKEMVVAPAVDWEKLETIGIFDHLRPYLIRTFNDARFGRVTDEAWNNTFRIHEKVYMELTLEFLATFKYEKEDTPEIIRFRLMGNWHDVSLARFAFLLGLYTEDFTSHPNFPTYLNTFEKGPFTDTRCLDFFQQIANVTTAPSDNKATQIRDPIHRMLHRFITFTVSQSYNNDKCPHLDLFPLWGAIYPETKVNLPHLFALYFRERSKGQSILSPICGGNFITRIAKNLDGTSSILKLTMKSETPKVLSESHFKNMIRKISRNVYTFVDPTPVMVVPADEQEQAQPAAPRHTRPRQNEPIQPGPQPEMNIQFLYDQMREMHLARQQEANALGEYFDDTHQFMGHMYQQAGRQLPPQFPYQTYNQRMGRGGS